MGNRPAGADWDGKPFIWTDKDGKIWYYRYPGDCSIELVPRWKLDQLQDSVRELAGSLPVDAA